MILGIGLDVVAVERIARSLAEGDGRFEEHVFTLEERGLRRSCGPRPSAGGAIRRQGSLRQGSRNGLGSRTIPSAGRGGQFGRRASGAAAHWPRGRAGASSGGCSRARHPVTRARGRGCGSRVGELEASPLARPDLNMQLVYGVGDAPVGFQGSQRCPYLTLTLASALRGYRE